MFHTNIQFSKFFTQFRSNYKTLKMLYVFYGFCEIKIEFFRIKVWKHGYLSNVEKNQKSYFRIFYNHLKLEKLVIRKTKLYLHWKVSKKFSQ